MRQPRDFDFNGKGVSAAYDDVLVPVLFEPWAKALVKRVPVESHWFVVDLATGTGVVAQQLAGLVGGGGIVTAIDLSTDMLSVAKQRCSPYGETVRFVESPASPLRLGDEVADVVYCQQGFQFFPDKRSAAAEIFRVLKPGSITVVSTWYPVGQCQLFGTIHDQLKRCGQDRIAELIALPFDHMPADELVSHFASAGFDPVTLETPQDDMVFEGGVEQAYKMVYATPIGPHVRAMPDEILGEFRDGMKAALGAMTKDGVTRGAMKSNLLIARKPG